MPLFSRAFIIDAYYFDVAAALMLFSAAICHYAIRLRCRR